MAVKKKNPPKKRSASAKQGQAKEAPEKEKPAVVSEMKKIFFGVCILVSVCLTAAMIADLILHPGRSVKKEATKKTVASGEIKPVEEGISEPKEKKQAEGLKEKALAEKPAVEKPVSDKPSGDKPAVNGKTGDQKSIKYEVFEGIDQTLVEKPPVKLKDKIPRIALIIDDIGYDKKVALELRDIHPNLTFSVLPFSPYGREICEELHSKGAEIMLHLPMEPLDYPNADPGPGAILSSMPPDTLLDQLKKDIKDVPYITGVNNHMGSELTTRSDQMNQIFTILKKENLFFIDSRTSIKTQALASARLLKVRFASRDVFLDNRQDVDYISGQLKALVTLAQKNGVAIGIGHPHKTTAAALSKELPKLKGKVEIVRASELTFIPE